MISIAAPVVVLTFSTFSTLTPDEGMMTKPPAVYASNLYQQLLLLQSKKKKNYSRSSSKCSGKVDIYHQTALTLRAKQFAI
jgi:hypothetical protein